MFVDDERNNYEEFEMIDIMRAENERLKDELVSLRKLILQADPSVMLDGRFEKMMIAPINIIGVARNIIEQMPHLQSDKKH